MKLLSIVYTIKFSSKSGIKKFLVEILLYERHSVTAQIHLFASFRYHCFMKLVGSGTPIFISRRPNPYESGKYEPRTQTVQHFFAENKKCHFLVTE